MVHPNTNLRLHEEIGPTVIVRGKGVYVYDADDKEYLESAAGLWCASLGFSSDRLADVAAKTMRELGFYHTFRHATNKPAALLCGELLRIAPRFSKVLLQSSGSEANDTALKLAWYFWDAQGKKEKRKIISRHKAYHGTTVAAASLTGKPEFHAGYGLPIAGFLRVSCPDYYWGAQSGESEESYSKRLAQELEDLIIAEGPDTIAAFFAEPVMGSAGAIIPPKGYFQEIQRVLKRHDILLVADEVICGFGRTGSMWGSETFGMEPDMLTCAKALSAAMLPISAVLVSGRIYQAMVSQSDARKRFVHGYTYSGHPVTSAVALETLKIYAELDIATRVSTVCKRFAEHIARLEFLPIVGEAKSVGLLAGIQLVADKAAKRDFEDVAKVSDLLDEISREQGLILRIIGSRIALSPPLIITEAEIDDLFARLNKSLAVLAKRLA